MVPAPGIPSSLTFGFPPILFLLILSLAPVPRSGDLDTLRSPVVWKTWRQVSPFLYCRCSLNGGQAEGEGWWLSQELPEDLWDLSRGPFGEKDSGESLCPSYWASPAAV